MPKLWNDTIDAHRRAVRDATMDATAALVTERGLAGVTMSQIAEETGIARATLYKYFRDVEGILVAWHERQIAAHLQHLVQVRDRAPDPRSGLAAVLEAYAGMRYGHHGADLASLLHREQHVQRAEKHLLDFLAELIADGVSSDDFRDDVPPIELAGYCVHALSAASDLRSRSAVRRLVAVTLDGLTA